MISGFGWAGLALLFGYLSLFFWGSALAAHLSGKPIWLFSRAVGRARLAGECLKLCVSDLAHAVFRYAQASKRPANIMAS